MSTRSRSMRAGVAGLGLLLTLAGCGSSAPARSARPAGASHHGPTQTAGARRGGSGQRHEVRPRRLVLVTDPVDDHVLFVSVPQLRVLRRMTIPGEPEYAETIGADGAAVVSARSGTVTLLSGPRWHTARVLNGLVAPHIPALAPGGDALYVTDDATGRLAAIALTNQRIVSRTFVGLGAHHLAFSPTAAQVWVALGQSARTITILSTRTPPPPGTTGSHSVNPARPHVVAQFDPGYRAHDLKFTPDGRSVWVTSASGPTIGVFDARTHRLRFRVPGGAPPQHVIFSGHDAYVTSGYGSSIERVRWATGRVLRRVAAPYGSFELDTSGPYVITSSLLRGTLAVYDRQLRFLRVRRVAASAEDVTSFAP
ncbi:MAG: hypothetical protein ABI355_19170 [Solirubrobacteraceae bacterium]